MALAAFLVSLFQFANGIEAVMLMPAAVPISVMAPL